MKYLVFLLTICGLSAMAQEKTSIAFDWQGHRGARGNYPENSIPAFLYAMDEKMNTLEMDVVVTADSQVVVSHEPFMSHEICLDPDSNDISARSEMRFNIYEMTYAEVQKFNCGSKPHPGFPDQTKIKVTKPLLKDVLELTKKHAKENNLPKPHYNIEIKSRPGWEGKYHPSIDEYVRLVMRVIESAGVRGRTTIQSFDARVLEHLDSTDNKVKLALLVDQSEDPVKKTSNLHFKPDILAVHYKLVNENLMKFAKTNNMNVVAWTVNDKDTARMLIDKYKVSGIITDFPLMREELEGPEKSIGPD